MRPVSRFYRDTKRVGKFVSREELPEKSKFIVRGVDSCASTGAVAGQHVESGDIGGAIEQRERRRSASSHPGQTRITMASRGSVLYWVEPPKTALIVKKQGEGPTSDMARRIVTHLREEYGVRALLDPQVARELPDLEAFEPAQTAELPKAVDFVISLGGDGTLLRVSSLFQGEVPPVLAFSMGSLGFLVPFRPEEYRDAIRAVYQGGFRFMKRMRLQARVFDAIDGRGRVPSRMPTTHVLNEVTINSETSRLAVIDCFVNGVLLARYVSDGIIASTSTGSTAYSLSCSGSLVHPGLHGIMVTPISPRQLSLRPAFLPHTAKLRFELSHRTRDLASVWVDGQLPYKLNRGGGVDVIMSPYPMTTVINRDPITDWVEQIGGLGFGRGLGTSP